MCRLQDVLLAVADTALCLFVFFPLAVLHWRGTWDLLDVYVIPTDLLYSSWATLIIGSSGCFLGYLIQRPLGQWALQGSTVRYVLVSRLYLYAFSWALLCYWRGVWNLMDLYMGEGIPNAVTWYILGVGLSGLFRTLRTNAGLPVQIQIDTDPTMICEPDTRFKFEPTDFGWYMLDVCFSQFVLVTLTVFVWRGIWNVLDGTFLPDNHLLSDVASLLLGYLLLLLLFLLQYPAALLSSALERRHVIAKILFEDVIMLCATWAVLLLWRGAWDLLHSYFFPDELVGGWVSHGIGAVGLFVLQGYGNVGTNGIDVDGSYTQGQGIFQTNFLRIIFGGKREKFDEEEDPGSEDKEHLLSVVGEDSESDRTEFEATAATKQ